jgi:UDP-N-acetylglucosamine--N-acetylmuramyl-(pentapeptide) pyrophosphoryl-undecaprenol N-acetylglucosamine transferase
VTSGLKICLAAGGTGGHVLPGLAVARALRERGHRVHFVLPTHPETRDAVVREGFPSSAFRFAGFPRRWDKKAMAFPFLLAAGLLSARRVLKREKPDGVLGMGGYITVPIGLMALRGKIPVVLHEQNSRAGLANRLLGRWAAAAAVSFENTEGLPSGRWTGFPLREGLRPRDGDAARREWGLDPDRLTVLVFGGSQGAAELNRRVSRALGGLSSLRDRAQVIHLTGLRDEDATAEAYRRAGWRSVVKAYWSDMGSAYSAADFVIARAGAGTVMELRRMGPRALLVPYPFATDDHQYHNALYLKSQGQAEVLREEDLPMETLADILSRLPEASVLRAEKDARLRALPAFLDRAAQNVAEVVEDAVGTNS